MAFDPTTADLIGYLRTGINDVRVIHDLVNSAPTNEVAQICIETEIGAGCVVSEEQTEGKVRATEIAKVAGKDNTDKLPYVLSLVGRSLAALPKPLTFINAQVFATSEDTRKAIEYSLNECLEERFKG